MPTRTLIYQPTELIAHVPVDHFEIVNGPGAPRCAQFLRSLFEQGLGGSVTAVFTLKTAASTIEFKRQLRVSSIYRVKGDGSFCFTAEFSGAVVSGSYNVKDHTGWFNLD